MLVVWKLDRPGRNLARPISSTPCQELATRSVGPAGARGAQIDTTTAAGRLVFGIFAALVPQGQLREQGQKALGS